jgi:hypothetical protein
VVNDLIELLGIALVVAAASLVAVPLGLFVAGVLFIVLAQVRESRSNATKAQP